MQELKEIADWFALNLTLITEKWNGTLDINKQNIYTYAYFLTPHH